MKKLTVSILLATFILTAGGNIQSIGAPGWGAGLKLGWSCIVKFTKDGMIFYGWSRTPWGILNNHVRFHPSKSKERQN